MQIALSFVDLSPAWVALLAEIETGGKPDKGWGTTFTDDTGTAWGRFQFRRDAFEDVGLIDAKGNWIGKKYGVRNGEDFLDNGWAQLAALENLAVKNYGYIRNLDLSRFVGQEFDTEDGRVKVSWGGLMLAVHLGIGDLEKNLLWIEENGDRSRARTFPKNKKGLYRDMESRLFKGAHISEYMRGGGPPAPLSDYGLPELPEEGR